MSLVDQIPAGKPVAAIDFAAYVAVMTALVGWFPAIGALLSIVWLSIQIWESKTMVKIRQRRASRKRVIARLEAQERKKHEHPFTR